MASIKRILRSYPWKNYKNFNWNRLFKCPKIYFAWWKTCALISNSLFHSDKLSCDIFAGSQGSMSVKHNFNETNTVFTRFVARALIFFNQTHYRALIQTGTCSSTGACYFQSKIMHKNYLWRQIFHDINPFSMSIYSRQTQIIHIHIFTSQE